MIRPSLLAVCLLLPALTGCFSLFTGTDPTVGGDLVDFGFQVEVDSEGGAIDAASLPWPDFRAAADGGQPVLRILDHGAFAAFDSAAARFENLTGARVEHTEADDTGDALNRAIQDKDDPQFDIIYGLDNALLAKAVSKDFDLLEPYTPQLAPRVAEEHLFFADTQPFTDPWPATPVDHGWIAVNVDVHHGSLNETPIATLHDLRSNAGLFVTEDPNHSTPGLGFFLITVERFGETGAGSWKAYWRDLFTGPDGKNGTGDEVLVTSDWGTAYEVHFTGGYGQYTEGHIGDRPIVTSYTESPAYEAYFGAEQVPEVLLDPTGSTFHQVQTMGILKGTPNRAIAQAWIEFTLTKDFQELAAPENAVYPVDDAVSTDDVYGGVDPEPGTFKEFTTDWRISHVPEGEDEGRLDVLLGEWRALCEQYSCR